ncbi:glycosyl transferase family 2 [Sulfolobus islandicus M.14.25]|uniref:Glycosyl transferase family 2 n=1 Tax=Saccharolobus islandicus (strain M.14.25 / Kamchatka \|nr:glycosyltransferase [Sulfolobus islandicus]ACP37768.1 glycosyl transferase family 2 [Sulfolobus islandicus M.14.25]
MTIAACVVTYNPDIKILSKMINILNRSRISIILVDNNSRDKNFFNIIRNVNILIHLEKNFGLGKAYNICCKVSKELGIEWLLFLDQDSLPSEPFNINEVIEKLGYYKGLYNKTAIISINSNISTKIDSINDDFYLAKYIVGSGMIVRNDICDRYKFLENLFLYSIDIEYCTRLRRSGYYILAYKKQMLEYKLGESSKKYRRRLPKYITQILSKLTKKDLTSYPFYSNPIRYYLMLRNNMYLLIRRRIELSYSKYLLFFVLYLYESLGLKETLKYVLRAIRHGFIGDLDNDNKRIFNLD